MEGELLQTPDLLAIQISRSSVVVYGGNATVALGERAAVRICG
jgi:hypothetical protein